MVEQIADQLCLTVGGNFDLLVRIESEDETIESSNSSSTFDANSSAKTPTCERKKRARLERLLAVVRRCGI
jgi:hypothetical protein